MNNTKSSYDTQILPADDHGIAVASRLIASGEIVAIPTETVYGLAGDSENSQAVARIYEAKGRPSFNPLIAHVSDMKMAARLVEIDDRAAQLMEQFWPGALTLILPLKKGAPVSPLVTAGLQTLAVRCPAHPAARALIAQTGRALAAPSANASGRISPTRASHVMTTLNGRIPLILDGGAASAGVESTILALTDETPRLLREGAITADALGLSSDQMDRANPQTGSGSIMGSINSHDQAIIAPGMLASHYAPAQPVRLNAKTAKAGEFLIGFGTINGNRNLSASSNLTEAAAALFDTLYEAEASGAMAIAVAPIPDEGLGRAINDRLRRAAAPRPV